MAWSVGRYLYSSSIVLTYVILGTDNIINLKYTFSIWKSDC